MGRINDPRELLAHDSGVAMGSACSLKKYPGARLSLRSAALLIAARGYLLGGNFNFWGGFPAKGFLPCRLLAFSRALK